MKINNILSICLILPGTFQAGYILIDKIDSIVCGPEQNTPITKTDIEWKRDLTNKFIPLNKQIETEVVNQQLIVEKIMMEPDAAEKYVKSIQKQNNFSEADMSNWFNQTGRTFQEGIDLLKNQYNNEYFLHFKFKSQLAPTEDEIKAYYNDNPEFIDATIKLRATRAAYEEDDKDRFKKDLEDMIQKELDKQESGIEWSEPTVVVFDDIPEDESFLRDMKPGEIKLTNDEQGVFELYQILEYNPAALVPLDDRRTMIVDALNRKELEKMFADYNKAVREYIDVIKFV